MNEIINTNATEIAENVIDPIVKTGGTVKYVLAGFAGGIVATIGTCKLGKLAKKKFSAHQEKKKESKIHRIDGKTDDDDKNGTD